MELTAYFLGALAVLTYKMARYIYHGRNQGKVWRQALLEWFFSPTKENATSWVTTIGVVWMFGGWYVGAFSWGGEPQTSIPVHASIAFTLGSLMEFIAPAIAKKIVTFAVNRFPVGEN